MVDLEYWMEQASAAGLIRSKERTVLLKAARNIFFAERTPDRLMDALHRAIGGGTLDCLLAFSGGTIPSIKAVDSADAVRLSVSLAQRREPDQRVTGI